MTAIFNFLMIAGAIQGFVFNVATFLSRKKIERPVLFLNLFVLFLSLNNLQSWFIEKRFIPSELQLHDFTFPWYVLIVPMFYAFLVYYLEIEQKRFSFLKISIGVFCIELITRSAIIYLVNTGIWAQSFLDNYNNIEDFVTLSYSLFLFYEAVKLVFREGPLLSPISNFDDLRWLKWFFYFGAGVFMLWIMSIVFNVTGLVQKPYSYYPLRLGSSLLIYWVGYQAFFRYVVLKDRILLRKKIRKIRSSEGIGKTGQERGAVVFSEIDNYIIKNQKFLDPYLSLEGLAEETKRGMSSLSKVINVHARSNFSDYINKYRVEEAKRLLASAKFSEYTIVSIGLECGFNSKSTFYTAFKKFTGETPIAFRIRATT